MSEPETYNPEPLWRQVWALKAENMRLQRALNVAAKIEGEDAEAFDWNVLDKIFDQELEIERLRKVEAEFKGYIPFLAAHGFFKDAEEQR